MRYDNKTKDNVRQLRKSGFSLDQIYIKTGIPRTTIHIWVREIKLSEKQSEILRRRVHNALQKGRIKREKLQLKNRLENEKEWFLKGKREIGKLSQRELFLSGIALYWAEGFKNKHEHRLGFCNSDPEMMKFYIRWLEKVLSIDKNNITARLTLNIAYKDKARDIEEYWSKETGVSLNQFTKTFYQVSRWKKQFANDDYHGVLRIHVKGSLDHLLKMRGWIEGMKTNVIK